MTFVVCNNHQLLIVKLDSLTKLSVCRDATFKLLPSLNENRFFIENPFNRLTLN